jgi:hypothetical protein
MGGEMKHTDCPIVRGIQNTAMCPEIALAVSQSERRKFRHRVIGDLRLTDSRVTSQHKHGRFAQ